MPPPAAPAAQTAAARNWLDDIADHHRIYARQSLHLVEVPARESQRLAHAAPPAWCFVNVPMVDISSTEIRARGDWG